LISRKGTATRALSLAQRITQPRTYGNGIDFELPFLGLATCLQLAEFEKPKWEQSRQEQSERGGFRDSSGATTASISACPTTASISACPTSATCPASATVQTAGAGRASVGDSVVAGKGNVTG
jgi:hypothetical protein